jgi:hypothetical protein
MPPKQRSSVVVAAIGHHRGLRAPLALKEGLMLRQTSDLVSNNAVVESDGFYWEQKG